MELSSHARLRWLQRCGHLDFSTEVAGLRRASKRTLNRLRRGWERSNGVGTWPAWYDYLVSPGGALFISDEGSVLTVLLLREVKQWDNRRSMDDRLKRKHTIV